MDFLRWRCFPINGGRCRIGKRGRLARGDLHKIRTAPNAGNATLGAATGGLPGQHMWIIIANDNVSAKTITFGANLLSAGPLAGATGKSATIHFVSDGTAWYEVSRTVGL
jgi:hypothetical protein